MRDEKMARNEIEGEALEIVATQIMEGYYSGMFDIEIDPGKYVSVSWSIDMAMTMEGEEI